MRALFLTFLVVGAAGCVRERGGALPFGAANADCATCHADQADAFTASAHGRATDSLVFAALLPRVEAAWGAPARARCESCHAPQHVPSALGPDGAALAPGGISCVSCHAAVGNRGSFDGRLVLDLGAPLDGPFETIEETPAHLAERRGFVSDAESCLTCHDVRGPELFVEPTGMEHEAAVSLVDAPGCASCHMPEREAGPIAEGASADRARRSHRFVGPTPPPNADAEGLLEYAESLRALFEGRVELTLSEADGVTTVRLANVGMGHALPTGVTFLRELVVEVTLTEPDGTSRTERVLVLGDRAMRGADEVALVTDADRIERRRIDPGESREVAIPLGTAVRVEARLVFRAYRAEVLSALELSGALAPAVTVLRAALERSPPGG